MTRTQPLAAALCATLLAGIAPAQQWDEAKALARIRLICMGDYMIGKQKAPPVSGTDVDLCFRALSDETDDVVIAGCRGMGVLPRRKFFRELPRKRLDEIVDLLIRRVSDPEPPVAYAAIQALISFDSLGHGGYARLQFSKSQRPQPTRPLLTPKQNRRIVSQCLAMVLSKAPDTQRMAGGMLRALADNVGRQVHVEIARSLLTAIGRFGEHEMENAEKEKQVLDSLKSALAVIPAPDAVLGDEMAKLFLADAKALGANHWSYYSKANCLRALSIGVASLKLPRRKEVIDYLCTTAQDRDLFFMTTSGVRSPFHHHGVMAVMRMVPVLSDKELAKVEVIVRAERKHFERVVEKAAGKMAWNKLDLESVFGDTEEAFAARRQELTKAKKN